MTACTDARVSLHRDQADVLRGGTSVTWAMRKALLLIDNGTNARLTDVGNVLVSRQAKALRDAGLIEEAPERWSAYRLTAAGREVSK